MCSCARHYLIILFIVFLYQLPGEFFDLIEQHIGLKDARYMTAYDVRVKATDTCESLGLNDRDSVTLFPQ